MTAIPARRRRRMVAAVTCSVLALIALPSGLVVGATTLLNDSGGDELENVATPIPLTPVELLVVVNDRNEVASLAMLALSPTGSGGTIVSIPVGAAADVAEGEPLRRIVDGHATGGLDAVRLEVEDLTNVTVDRVDEVTSAELAVLLDAVGSQPVTLNSPVTETGADGTPLTVLAAGSQTVTPLQIAQGLAAAPAGVPETIRLPQVKALWGAVARAGVEAATTGSGNGTGTDPATGTTTTVAGAQSGISAPADTAGFLSVLMKGRIDVWQFDATLITDPARNPANADMYSVDAGEVLMVMASVAPSALSLTSNDVAVMMDVPFDDAMIAKEAVTRLAFLGANVSLVRKVSGPPAEKTVVHFKDVLVRVEIEDFSTLIGPLEFVETTEQIEGINARIVLGYDFVRFLGNAVPAPSTTTTTVPS